MAKVLLKWKGTEKISDIDTRRGQRVPPSPVLPRPCILFQFLTNNRKVLPDSLPNIHFKITGLVRRFLRRRNRSLSKIHCCYIIISTDLKEKHTLEQDVLLCSTTISSGLKGS